MNEPQPRSFAFFLEQINQSNRLRWGFGVGISLLGFFVYWNTPYVRVIGLALAILIASNLGFGQAYRSILRTKDQAEKLRVLKRFAFAHAFLDLVFITVGIHFSGGSVSPFLLLYIFYIGANSLIFSTGLLLLLNVFSVFLYCGLIQLYISGIIRPLDPWFMQDMTIGEDFLRNAQFAFVGVMVLNVAVIYSYIRKMQLGWQDSDLQKNYLDRLNNLTKLGLEYHQTSSLYQILADETRDLLGADSVYIIRWDEELGRAFLGVVSGGFGHLYLPPSPQLSYAIAMARSVERARRSLVAENVFCSPYIPTTPIEASAPRSLIGLPLCGLPDNHFLGALMVAYNKTHYYSPEEISRIQQTVDVAALLISRIGLYEETLHRADLLQQLANQVTNITSDLHQTTLLPAVVEAASDLLHAQRAALHLYNRVSGEIRCEFSMGLSEAYLNQMTQRFKQVLGPQIFKDKPFVVVPDVYQDSRTSPIKDLITEERFRAYAVFALPSPNGSLGALSLYWDEPRVISSEEITVAELFAERAGALLYSARLFEQASEESLTDLLTGLPNRRALDQRLEEESRQADRYNRRYALLMIDLDGFKKINDTYGHPIGDSVLQQVTTALHRAVRSTDFISRYGGDEFAVILPESGLEKATFVAEKLKATLATTRLHLPNGKEQFLSASIGIAICPTDAFEHKKLLFLADERLYLAKRSGSGVIVTTN